MEKGGSDYRKAFGQFSSNKTQRPDTMKSAKVELKLSHISENDRF